MNLRRPPLPSHPYDVIVIGGGVNGAAIARECALGGKRTLVLEQHDFASGTSSRATRIIHGGLRYLEHGKLRLVRESLREREFLLRTRPELVHPLRFVLAMPKHSNPFSLRSPLALRVGLAAYRALSKRKVDPAAAKQDIATLERSLDAGERWTLLDYEDAQCEFPERLIADWIVEAVGAGAVARNHTQVLRVEIRHGRAAGVWVRDRLTGEESKVEGAWIINATGPWADRVATASNIAGRRMIGGVRGSHILLPRFPDAPQSAVYSEAADGRPIFVIPWNGQTLVGTTEVGDDADPGFTAPEAREIDYLLQAFRRIFPKIALGNSDIIACYAGVRPLPYSHNADASATTRRHFLHDHSEDGARGLISVIGGKLTTATSLARVCAKKVGIRPSLGAPLVVAPEMKSPSSAKPSVVSVDGLCEHNAYRVSDAVRAVENEYAVTLGDILLRRVPAALSACWSGECARIAPQRVGQALGWSESETEKAREELEMERAAFLIKPDAVRAW